MRLPPRKDDPGTPRGSGKHSETDKFGLIDWENSCTYIRAIDKKRTHDQRQTFTSVTPILSSSLVERGTLCERLGGPAQENNV